MAVGSSLESRAPPWPPVVARIAHVLNGTHEQAPRPISRLDLPEALHRLLAQTLERRLTEAAVLVALLQRPEGPTVLLTRRSEQLRAHQGQISFPGGRRDADDPSLAAAALREAEEEVGLPPEAVIPLGYLDDYPTLTGYRVTPLVAWVPEPPAQWRVTPDEVAEIIELPLAQALDLSVYRQQKLLRDGIALPFYELDAGAHRVWGATAGMLRELAERVHRG